MKSELQVGTTPATPYPFDFFLAMGVALVPSGKRLRYQM
jgi:hypothetical protein